MRNSQNLTHVFNKKILQFHNFTSGKALPKQQTWFSDIKFFLLVCYSQYFLGRKIVIFNSNILKRVSFFPSLHVNCFNFYKRIFPSGGLSILYFIFYENWNSAKLFHLFQKFSWLDFLFFYPWILLSVSAVITQLDLPLINGFLI